VLPRSVANSRRPRFVDLDGCVLRQLKRALDRVRKQNEDPTAPRSVRFDLKYEDAHYRVTVRPRGERYYTVPKLGESGA
jgi:hypothetical protein